MALSAAGAQRASARATAAHGWLMSGHSGHMDPGDLHPLCLDAGHLDACEPQYVEWLRDGSRQLGWARCDHFDTTSDAPDPATLVVPLCARVVWPVPAGLAAIER